jgi:hypothetical protein
MLARARPVNLGVMLLPIEQLCGSRLNYKLFHGFVRLTCSLSIALVFLNIYLSHKFVSVLPNSGLEDLDIHWFFISPLVVLSMVVFESLWLRRTEPEMRSLAIDWLFVLAYLCVWCFGIVMAWVMYFPSL